MSEEFVPVAAVDFDGTICSYRGFGNGEIKGGPLPQAKIALKMLREAGYRVVVHSARDPVQIAAWLQEYGMFDLVYGVTRTKLPSMVVFFDDRAVHVEPNKRGALLESVVGWLKERQAVPNIQATSMTTLEGFNE